MTSSENNLKHLVNQPYKYGFTTTIESESLAPGLNEEVIRTISAKKNEPSFILDFRLKAFKKWSKMKTPQWAHLSTQKIDYQNIVYYSAPKKKKVLNDLNEVDPELKRTFDKLGISQMSKSAWPTLQLTWFLIAFQLLQP